MGVKFLTKLLVCSGECLKPRRSMAAGMAKAKVTGTCWQRGLRPWAWPGSGPVQRASRQHQRLTGQLCGGLGAWPIVTLAEYTTLQKLAHCSSNNPVWGVIQVAQGFQKRLARINPFGLGVGRAKSMAPNGGPQQSKNSRPVNCKPCKEKLPTGQL